MSTLRATNIKHELSATNQIVLGADGSIGGTLGDTLAAKVDVGAAGQILQVVNATYSTEVTIATTTITDTGLSASITPLYATSKILVMATMAVRVRYNGTRGGADGQMLYVYRDSTQVWANERFFEYMGASTTNPYMVALASLHYVDSPATTSAVTYKTRARTADTNWSATFNTISTVAVPSQLILMEIAA